MSSAIKDQIIRELEQLDEVQLRAVLGSVRRTQGKLPPGVPGSEFGRRVSGLIPPDALERMEKVIEEDCERIEPDEW